ncbi:MAG: hypothetical protein IKH13_01450 [Clostridia bacterium]|nr:hypothetical protein [Clostridia bacterium]
MKTAKRALSLFLTVTLILTTIPIMAHAESAPDPMDEAVEAIEANLLSEKDAEKAVLENREELVKSNTVEVTSGSNSGFVLENGKTYIFKKDVKFTNSTPSGSAITVPAAATVTMQIEKDVTVTAIGSDSESPLGAGAGIYVPESATLIIRGEGALIATGGNAADGENGSRGESSRFDKASRNGNGLIYAGNGGSGGAGGGGAGAGIGGTGGDGGMGGEGGLYKGYKDGKNTFPYDEKITDLTLVGKEEGVSGDTLTGRLFDNFIITKCKVEKTGTVRTVIRTSKPEKTVSYGLAVIENKSSVNSLPSSWIVYGSNDNINWTSIATVKNPDATKRTFNFLKYKCAEYRYNIDKPGTYKYYRFDFDVNGSLQLNDVYLYREAANHPASPTEADDADINGENGKNGKNGTKGADCGVIYILEQVSVTATPGKAGSKDGEAGDNGAKANDKGSGYSYYYYAGGGGGGGGGARGEAPTYGIGEGGDGGCGGGGGGAGSTRYSKNNNDYDDDDHAKGGDGGTAYSLGEEGRSFGSQKGGDGGNGGSRLKQPATPSGIVCANFSAKVEGRLEGDIERGVFSFSDEGGIVDMAGIPVTDINGFTPENNKLYRFANDISYTAPNGQNAITVPENSTITLEIPKDINVSLKGGNANGADGAGAGICVPESSTLIIRGSGALTAVGGNAGDATNTSSGGGAGAGIGGAGGRGISKDNVKPERGTNCGKVYILGSLKLYAHSGLAFGKDTKLFTGGKAADYGIGGGGAGGNIVGRPVQLSGKNGEIYEDYASERITGRNCFYHRADLSVDMMGNVTANGYTDMILGNPFSENISAELLYTALREVANHNALKKDEGWNVVDLFAQEGGETNDSCNGAYRKGNEWNKDIIDISGGYVYLFTTYFGRYIKSKLDSAELTMLFASNPTAVVEVCWKDISDYAESKGQYISEDMKTLMREILYHEHYCEPFGGNRASGYIFGNPTNDKYSSKNKALQQIDFTYTSVLDCETARYATFAYDTARMRTDKSLSGKARYYYSIINSSFMCVDGYKGVTTKNWMKFIPDNASVGQLNMPGTHDSGTYNVMFNYEALDVIMSNIGDIYGDNVPDWITAVAAIGSLAGIAFLAFIDLLIPLLALASAAAIYIACNWAQIVQYFINALAQCNHLTMEQQMNAGIRTFDIRMVYNSDRKYKDLDNEKLKGSDRYYEAGFLKVCHGTLGTMGLGKYSDHDVSLADGHNPDGTLLTFKNMIEDALAFVKQNPSESVYLTFKCEGSNDDGRYTEILKRVFADAEGDPRVVVLKEGQPMPTVGSAAGKVYLIERRFAEFTEDHYDVSAADKIEYLKKCFRDSQKNDLRQHYDSATPIDQTRMIYSSTYKYSFNKGFLTNPFDEKPLSGSPEQLAYKVNDFLDTWGYQRGQRYGWIYMNFPTQMATSNLIFSNIFDMKKLVQEHNEGSLFTDFNGVVFFGLLAVFAVPVIAIPIVKKKKSKKDGGAQNEETDEE